MNLIRNNVSFIACIFGTAILLGGLYILLQKFPMQELNINAKTASEKFDASGTTDLYYFGPMDYGSPYTAVIKFMAVKNTSKNLFTSYGKGPYVYLGCSELNARCQFTSFDKFMHIRLAMDIAQADLRLEGGAPFDITRYSLKPVLVMEQ